MASVLFLKGIEVALDALMQEAAAPSGTVKLTYMDTTYTPDSVNDQYFSDISAEVASGAPTETLTTIDVAIDSTNSRVSVDADDVSEAGVTTTTDKFVIYLDTGTDSTSPLIYCGDIGSTLTPVAGTLALAFNSNGIFAINDN